MLLCPSHRFATKEQNGLLLYNGRFNEKHDFVALEIVHEQIQLTFSAGMECSGPVSPAPSSPLPLWASVPLDASSCLPLPHCQSPPSPSAPGCGVSAGSQLPAFSSQFPASFTPWLPSPSEPRAPYTPLHTPYSGLFSPCSLGRELRDSVFCRRAAAQP